MAKMIAFPTVLRKDDRPVIIAMGEINLTKAEKGLQKVITRMKREGKEPPCDFRCSCGSIQERVCISAKGVDIPTFEKVRDDFLLKGFFNALQEEFPGVHLQVA